MDPGKCMLGTWCSICIPMFGASVLDALCAVYSKALTCTPCPQSLPQAAKHLDLRSGNLRTCPAVLEQLAQLLFEVFKQMLSAMAGDPDEVRRSGYSVQQACASVEEGRPFHPAQNIYASTQADGVAHDVDALEKAIASLDIEVGWLGSGIHGGRACRQTPGMS